MATKLTDARLNGIVAGLFGDEDQPDLDWSDTWDAVNVDGETRRYRKLVWIWSLESDAVAYASVSDLASAINQEDPSLRCSVYDEEDGTPAIVVSEDIP